MASILNYGIRMDLLLFRGFGLWTVIYPASPPVQEIETDDGGPKQMDTTLDEAHPTPITPSKKFAQKFIRRFDELKYLADEGGHQVLEHLASSARPVLHKIDSAK